MIAIGKKSIFISGQLSKTVEQSLPDSRSGPDHLLCPGKLYPDAALGHVN